MPILLVPILKSLEAGHSIIDEDINSLADIQDILPALNPGDAALVRP